MYSNLWVEEKFEDIYGMRFKVENVLFSGKSKFQSVDVVETKGHGKMLLNDGLVMLTERDEFIYHDMISHIPLFVHPQPKNVLIIGGGDGGTAREVLRHSLVEKCVMVEIDKMVVDACVEHIPQTACELNNTRLELIIDDGVEYVKNTNEKFDIVIVDSTDPIGPAKPLFDVPFYQDIYNLLNDDGIVISQGESPFYNQEMQEVLLNIKNKLFPIVQILNFSNLTYPGGLWSFSIGSKKYNMVNDFDPERVRKSNIEFQYYNENIHRSCFSLPSFMYNRVGKYLKD